MMTTNTKFLTIAGGVLVGYYLIHDNFPVWFYNGERELKTTGLNLKQVENIIPSMNSILSENFLTFHNFEGVNYDVEYVPKEEIIEISESLTKDIVEAGYELHSMCMEVVERVVLDDVLLELFEIPDDLREQCKASWNNRDTDFIGRFDFIYDGQSKPKLLEYNADTPTTLIESGAGQMVLFNHKKDLHLKHLQFNCLDTAIVHFWKKIAINNKKYLNYLFTTDNGGVEEFQTVSYMKYLFKIANFDLNAIQCDISSLHSNGNHVYVDEGGNKTQIDVMYKLYPYEWLNEEEFGKYFEQMSNNPDISENLNILEPYWKLILSSKALLPFLWEMFPEHPNLLPAYFEHPSKLNNDQAIKDMKKYKDWVSKPKFGREGEDIHFAKENTTEEETIISYVKEINDVKVIIGTPIYQAFAKSVTVKKMYPTFGLWIVNGLPVSLGIRLCLNKFANHDTSFYPHFFFPSNNTNFELACTQRQRDFRNSLYGDERQNVNSTYNGRILDKMKIRFIDHNHPNHKYHEKSEITHCHCGGGCASYRRASYTSNQKANSQNVGQGENVNGEKKTSGRKFNTKLNRVSTGRTSKIGGSKG